MALVGDDGVCDEPVHAWTGAQEARLAVREWPPAVAGGHALEVTVIRPGRSQNGLHYPAQVLREAVPLWEGAAAFCDHPTALDQTRAGGRSVRDLVGVYAGAHYEEGSDTGDGEGGIRATLRLYPNAEWLFHLIEAAMADREAGRAAPDIGISADMRVLKERRGDEWQVRRIVRVNSGDVVFQPAAGGRFERILEGKNGSEKKEKEVQTKTTGADQVVETLDAVTTAQEELARLRQMREELCSRVLEAKLQSSGLPAAAQAKVRQALGGRVFEAGEVDREIGSMREVLSQALKAQVVRGMGQPRVTMGLGPREKMQMAVDRLFGLEVADPSVPRLSGIREAYLLITGDRQFRGKYNWEESVVREANEVTTSVLADTLLNSMTKRLVKDYQAQPRWWRPVVRVVGITDMKEQNRVLLNDFAALSTVGENAAYSNLAWGDTRENYTPGKRGNLVVVTLESILNDDLHAITRIPTKLAASAAVTLNEFVSGLFTANAGAGPAMADTFNVFDAGNHQGNSGTTALSSAAVQSATVAMLKYANSASKRLGVRPRYLLVPAELAFTAQVITESTQAPGGSDNDVNVLRGALEPIVVPQWTDANNWYLMADPAVVEGIEIGFLNGQETPDLLVQDNPTDGSVFTNDAISYKVRHIFGGGWLDYRAGYASIVA